MLRASPTVHLRERIDQLLPEWGELGQRELLEKALERAQLAGPDTVAAALGQAQRNACLTDG